MISINSNNLPSGSKLHTVSDLGGAKSGNTLPPKAEKPPTKASAQHSLAATPLNSDSLNSVKRPTISGAAIDSTAIKNSTINTSNPSAAPSIDRHLAEGVDLAQSHKESALADDSSLQGRLQSEEKSPQDEITSAVAKLNDFVQVVQRDLEFSLDEDSGMSVVRVVDRTSKELVRQIPTELVLELARNLNDEPLRLFNVQV